MGDFRMHHGWLDTPLQHFAKCVWNMAERFPKMPLPKVHWWFGACIGRRPHKVAAPSRREEE